MLMTSLLARLFEQVRSTSPGHFTVTTRVHHASGGVPTTAPRGRADDFQIRDSEHEAAVEMDVTVYAARNQEVVLRVQSGLLSAVTSTMASKLGTSFHTHDGLAWRRRGPPPGMDRTPFPAAAFFPTAVGAALRQAGNGTGGTGGTGAHHGVPQQLTLLFDRSVGAARVGDGGLEILLHRSLGQV